MPRTCIANIHHLIGDGMLTVCNASVDSMDVVDATTNRVLLDDSDTHDDPGGVGSGEARCCIG